jgi:hypothetical protein
MLRLFARGLKKVNMGNLPMARAFGGAATHHDHHESDDDHGHGHGHGHHAKEYDWRDDPKVNKDFQVDWKDRGWDISSYTFPYQGKDDWFFPAHPEGVDLDTPYINLRPENRVAGIECQKMPVHHSLLLDNC